MNTTIPQVFVGIDVGKNFLDLHIFPLNKAFRIANNAQGMEQIIDVLAHYDVLRIACEPSGGYEYLLLQTLRARNYRPWLVEPKRIRAFIISEGIKVKTDKIDAKMIALFVSQRSPNYHQKYLDPQEEQLKSLVLFKSHLTVLVIDMKNSLKQSQQPQCKELMQKTINFIKAQIAEVKAQVDDLIDNNHEWKAKSAIITSIPGVGHVTMTTLLSQMPELGLITDKQAASLVGVAPVIQQSGTSKGTASIKGGRDKIRRVLYMATLATICHNPVLKAFYQRLKKNGKKSKVAIVATMRKLITILNVLVKKGVLWKPA